MKIIILINNLGIGGAERLVIDDIHEFIKRGMEVELVTLKPENKDKTLSKQLSSHCGWKVFDFGSFLNIKSWILFCRLLKSSKPDVLVTHLWYSNFIGRIAGKLCRVKNIITFEHNVYDTLKTKKMFFIDRMLQNFSNHIVAVSRAVRDSLVRHGIREEKIKVICNGIDTSKYKDTLRVHGLEFTFIFIGRLIHQKGVDILLKAFSRVDTGKLLVVGTGAEETGLKSLAKELKIENRVDFLGNRQDIPTLLSSADCFVLPSRYEGLPMVLLEAVAAEKPIIVSDFLSAKEIIENQTSGIIVPKEDVGELAFAMNKIAKDDALRRVLVEGVKKIVPRISIKNHVDELINLY